MEILSSKNLHLKLGQITLNPISHAMKLFMQILGDKYLIAVFTESVCNKHNGVPKSHLQTHYRRLFPYNIGVGIVYKIKLYITPF